MFNFLKKLFWPSHSERELVTYSQFVFRKCEQRTSPLPIEDHEDWYRREYEKYLDPSAYQNTD